jgi:hypothetical protein
MEITKNREGFVANTKTKFLYISGGKFDISEKNISFVVSDGDCIKFFCTGAFCPN